MRGRGQSPRPASIAWVLLLPAAMALIAFASTAAPGRAQAGPDGATAAAGVVVYLLRHAERATDHPTDPGLTPEGEARAARLAVLLGEAGATHIHTTPLRRTRLTAAPLAGRLGLEVQDYDPTALRAFAEALARTPGRHVVVGHSNTTPEVVALLGGERGPPIDDATEFDRLYVVTLGPGGTVTTVVLRY